MLKREIIIDGKTHETEVSECPIGKPFQMKINNKTSQVLLEHELNRTTNFPIKINGKSYQITLPSIGKNEPFSIKVNNVSFNVEIKTATPRFAVTTLSPTSEITIRRPSKNADEGAIIAPMAGKITSIKVSQGDSVKMGTILCVLEAMKMENEIASPKNGVVQEIKIQEGKAVNEGDVLMMVK